ncbi:MAG: carbohydrate-binding protein [Pseudomonadota bacterium]
MHRFFRYVLVSVLASGLLAACGGNSSGIGSAATAASEASTTLATAGAPALAASSTTQWTFCANEGGRCLFNGTQTVRFGTGDRWVSKNVDWGTACDVATFGDPAYGVAKHCEVTSKWEFCGNENQQCAFGNTQTVRYGAGGTFFTKTVSNGLACNNATFGDPAFGVGKHCDRAQTTWTLCAKENGRCNFSGAAVVLYGAKGTFVTRNGNDGIDCNNGVFGDPIAGPKSCYIPGAPISDVAGGQAIGAADITYEAENNFISGGVFSNGNYLEAFSTVGARVVLTVKAGAAGARPVNLRYANGTGNTNTLNVYVNGLYATTTSLAPTGGPTAWQDRAETLTLRAGVNTISYQVDPGNSGAVNIDAVRVQGGVALAARGATLPYVEYEAEDGKSNVAPGGPGTTYLTEDAESSGRKNITLFNTGHFVEWTAKQAANALTVRYSMADASQGGGTNNTLSLYINGVKVRTLDLSSRFAWLYGDYPFNDNPGNGRAHRFYDESSFTGLNIAQGAVVRLQKDGGDTANYYKIDLVDLEQVDQPYGMPSNFVSINNYGAVANDGRDDSGAINNAMRDAKSQGKNVWIPAGTFHLADRINLDGVQVHGAGMWHTTLQGMNGKGGFYAVGGRVTIGDLTVRGDSTVRNDAADHAAFEGNFGSTSLIQNVWVEHMKVGLWASPGTNGLLMTNGRIRDTWADGVNLSGGVLNTTVSNMNLRNTGDDAMAMWSNGSANVNNTFRFNTAQLPILANTFAIYGGQANKLFDNIGADTVTSSAGITISTRFNSVPFSGTTEVRRNTLTRTGGWEPNWNASIGALWIFAEGIDITAPIVVDTLELNNSTYDGVLLSFGHAISNLTLNNVQINNSGNYGMYFSNVTGNGNFSGVTVSGSKVGAISNGNNQYSINRGANNSGW